MIGRRQAHLLRFSRRFHQGPARSLSALFFVVALTACEAPLPDNLLTRQTEGERLASSIMVSSPHPLATEAGLEVLRSGGNAIDAAVAVQMVLGFVEAPETGIGGGGFLLFRDGSTGKLHFYDGRETAPAAAGSSRFSVLGQPVPLWAAVPSGRSVGVPGLVAMLGLAHRRHGSRPWAELLQPAITHATEGVPMPDRMRLDIARDLSLQLFGDMRRHFIEQSQGEFPRLANLELAMTLQAIATDGPDAFYHGDIAADVVGRASERWPWPGDLTVSDLAAYQAVEREPVCGPYREWTICGASPPSSGGIAVLQILGLLERFPLAELGPESVEAIHLIAEASRLAFADRYRYLGDPDFVNIPVAGLIDRDYLAERSRLINPAVAMPIALPGKPGDRPVIPDAEPADDAETVGTSHFSIVDAAGNLVALTSSIEAPFGARMMTRGFLLNNQLTDFTFDPEFEDGQPHPNAVAPGKRPRSSMSPVMVFDADGKVRLVIGSRGGARIIGYVVKALIGTLDWKLDIQDAVALPNFVHRGKALELERGSRLEAHAETLKAMGHEIAIVRMTSGLNGMERILTGWRGAADPRLDGIAAGD